MLSRTPPMGFNTWNTFGENINDEMIRQTADKMVELGLRDAGYEYLVIDDCWSEKERDEATGKIIPDHVKFPNGMKAVSDYVHSKGLKFGMYSCAGVRTCADYPGSFDHEFLDARTFAEYGADFLKYDFCNKPEYADGPLLYKRMSMALKSCGREILFSACNWGCDEVNTWIRSVGAHMYRSTGDINDSFRSVRDLFISQLDHYAYSAPGCFNDIDMLIAGMYAEGNVGAGGCTDTEYKTHFALWCIASSPLMIGCDIRKINDTTLNLLKNKNLIRINQDEEGRPPMIVFNHDEGRRLGLVKVLSDNEFAVMLANLSDSPCGMHMWLEDIGLPAAAGKGLRLKDAFTDEDRGVIKEKLCQEVAPHDCALYLAKLADV
ncbi:MAG: glycoside hydrolase family 27 protein [Clostridia bacterium]|nr:glycoside hydrolase family 27 protein [Clostridia bacterium]